MKGKQDQTITIGNFTFVVNKIVAFFLPSHNSHKLHIYCENSGNDPFIITYSTLAEALSDWERLKEEINCYYNEF